MFCGIEFESEKNGKMTELEMLQEMQLDFEMIGAFPHEVDVEVYIIEKFNGKNIKKLLNLFDTHMEVVKISSQGSLDFETFVFDIYGMVVDGSLMTVHKLNKASDMFGPFNIAIRYI